VPIAVVNSASLAQACLPLIVAIAACGLFAAVLIRAMFPAATRRPATIESSGAVPTALQFHRDTRGAVQSLAFVLTFPLFLLIVMFVVQLSQLLIGVVTVQYAAFAAARAASVWIPAVTMDSSTIPSMRSTNANVLPAGAAAGSEVVWNAQIVDALGSLKARKIWSAAALACVSIAPSRTTASSTTSSFADSASGALTAVVRALDSNASANARLPQRLSNKTNYSFANTSVALRFDDRSSSPFAGEIHTYNPVGHPTVPYAAAEVGWQDPVEITVRHKFALLPGPGRWLAAGIANGDGRILLEDGVYKTTLSATATMTIEGLQSLRPRTHAP